MTPPNVIFIPTPATDTPLQTIVTSPSSSGAGTTPLHWDSIVSNTGQQIIGTRLNGIRWSEANGYWKPRLWNGAEAVNSGASSIGGNRYAFSTSTDCRSWWDNYIVTIEMEGNLYTSFGDPVSGSCQPAYINCSVNVIPTSVAASCRSNDSNITYRVYNAT